MAFEHRVDLSDAAAEIVPRRDQTEWPMSAAQKRIWSLSRLRPDDPVYNIERAWRLEGPLHPTLLEASIGEILRRHEALRARFTDQAGVVMQSIAPFEGFRLAVERLSARDGVEPLSLAKAAATMEAERAFDVANDSLMRGRLLVLGRDDHVLVLTAHHLVCDGWSMDIVERELSVVYRGLLEGAPVSLEPLTIQYADFAAWQHETRHGPSSGRDLDFWEARLEGVTEPLHIPGRSRPHAREAGVGAHLEVIFDAELTSRLKDLSRAVGVTTFTTLLTGFQLAVHQVTGQEEVVICSPTAGRAPIQTEPLVGYFNNLVVLRGDLSGDFTIRQLFERNLIMVLEALDHQGVEFLDVATLPSVATVPLARVMLDVPEVSPSPLQLPGVAVSSFPVEAGTADFEVAVFVREENGRFRTAIRFQRDLFAPDDIQALLSRFESMLWEMVEGPDLRPSRLVPTAASKTAEEPGTAGVGAERDERPPNLLETQLVEIWQRVFKRSPISIYDDFFDLGGHSLLAAEMIAEIEQRILQEPMPLATLFRAPTIAELSDVIAGGGWAESWASLVPIQPNGSQPPLFFVHAHGGNVIGYRDLAKRLGDDQPFYGLQAPEVVRDQGEIVPRRFEDMAARYVEELRSVQRQGPYLLGGWCLGADVAFEMAHQLTAAGEDVAMLVMVDNPRPEFVAPERAAPVVIRLWNRVRTRLSMEWSNLVEVEWARKPRFVVERISRFVSRGLVNIEILVANWVPIPHSRAYRHRSLEAAHEKAYEAWYPKPYSGAVALVRAEQQPFGRAADSALGWDRYVEGEVEVIEAPGHRVGLLSEPRVGVVAEQIRRAISRGLSVTDPTG